jgi:hypothetical protein
MIFRFHTRIILNHSSAKFVCNCADFTGSSLKKHYLQRISSLYNSILQSLGAYNLASKLNFSWGQQSEILLETI